MIWTIRRKRNDEMDGIIHEFVIGKKEKCGVATQEK